MLADLQKHLEEIGTLADHPWTGVSRTEPLLPTDMKELQARVAEAVGSLSGVIEAFGLLANAFDDCASQDSQLERCAANRRVRPTDR